MKHAANRACSPHSPRRTLAGSLGMLAIAVIVQFVLLTSLASAATFAVDDATSYTHEANTAMKWRFAASSRQPGSMVEGATRVTVRLNLTPWLNKAGKIYMTLPKQSVGPVKATWTTQGRMLAGQLIAGDRTLVFAGSIRSALLEDTILLTLETDGQRLIAPQRLQFNFEIDVE